MTMSPTHSPDAIPIDSARKRATVHGLRFPGKYPVRDRLTVTAALALEMGLRSEAMANKRLYEFPTIADWACAAARAHLAAGDEAGLQRFLHTIQAAGRRLPGPIDTTQLLELVQRDAEDNAPLTAFVAYHNRETFVAFRQKFYRFVGLGYGIVEAGNAEYGL